MPVNIWWIRRDLRLADNPALRAALQDNHAVLPVVIIDPNLFNGNGQKRQDFWLDGMIALDESLRRRGSGIIVRYGYPQFILKQIMVESGAKGIYAGEDYSPYARRRDERLAAELPLKLVQDLTAHHPDAVLKPDGSPYTVFTPYRKAWSSLPLAYSPPWYPPNPFPDVPHILSDPIPAVVANKFFPAGEQEAQRRLDQFLSGPVLNYALERDRLDLDRTSTLSPYLRFGMISGRRVVLRIKQKLDGDLLAAERKGCESWLSELVWREFYYSILYHFPQVLNMAFQPHLRRVAWRNAPDDFRAWQQGLTGYPVVDACMRQLNEMGWMHNRGRMIVASFLTKDLLINWQEGERWFMRQLVDGDPAANNGGWQWTAGVGTDAAPYFRIFNPILQSKKFDPNGEFIRRWVPELAHLSDALIHEPWLLPEPVAGYPARIVDHAEARERTLLAYRHS